MADVTKKIAVSLDLLLNELKNFKVESLSTAPETVAEGRVYFNTDDNTLYYGADGKWNPIATGGSVEEALKRMSLSLSPDSERVPTSWHLKLNGGGGGTVDVTDMMKNSSVIDIIQFKGETTNSATDNYTPGTYNAGTFTTSPDGYVFKDIVAGVSYLGLVIDDFGAKFDASVDKYRTLAFRITDFLDGVKGIMATNSAGSRSESVPLQQGKVVLKGNDEIAPNVDADNKVLGFSITELTTEKVYEGEWSTPEEVYSASLKEDETPKKEKTQQSLINEQLRDYAVSTQQELNSLKIYYNKNTREIQLLMGGFDLCDPIDASAFVKDGMLKTVVGPYTPPDSATTEWTVSVPWSRPTLNGPVENKNIKFRGLQYGKTYLGFIWDTDTSSEDDDPQTSLLDVSSLAVVYKAGAGVDLSDNTFSIKIQDSSNALLTVNEDGLDDSNIRTAIEKVTIGRFTKKVSITEENATGAQALTASGNHAIDPCSVRAFLVTNTDNPRPTQEEIGVCVTVGITNISVSWSNCPIGELRIKYSEYYASKVQA